MLSFFCQDCFAQSPQAGLRSSARQCRGLEKDGGKQTGSSLAGHHSIRARPVPQAAFPGSKPALGGTFQSRWRSIHQCAETRLPIAAIPSSERFIASRCNLATPSILARRDRESPASES